MASSYYEIDPDTTYNQSITNFTFKDYTYTIDANINMFRYNVYVLNTATNSKGILTILGSPRTFF